VVHQFLYLALCTFQIFKFISFITRFREQISIHSMKSRRSTSPIFRIISTLFNKDSQLPNYFQHKFHLQKKMLRKLLKGIFIIFNLCRSETNNWILRWRVVLDNFNQFINGTVNYTLIFFHAEGSRWIVISHFRFVAETKIMFSLLSLWKMSQIETQVWHFGRIAGH
jgi:hypothetical protein